MAKKALAIPGALKLMPKKKAAKKLFKAKAKKKGK